MHADFDVFERGPCNDSQRRRRSGRKNLSVLLRVIDSSIRRFPTSIHLRLGGHGYRWLGRFRGQYGGGIWIWFMIPRDCRLICFAGMVHRSRQPRSTQVTAGRYDVVVLLLRHTHNGLRNPMERKKISHSFTMRGSLRVPHSIPTSLFFKLFLDQKSQRTTVSSKHKTTSLKRHRSVQEGMVCLDEWPEVGSLSMELFHQCYVLFLLLVERL